MTRECDVGGSISERKSRECHSLARGKASPTEVPRIVLGVVVDTRCGRREWRESVHHLWRKQRPRKNKNPRGEKTLQHKKQEVHKRHSGHDEKNQRWTQSWCNVAAFVRMCCVECYYSLQDRQSVKNTTSPACGIAVVGDDSKCASCSGMVSAFVTQFFHRDHSRAGMVSRSLCWTRTIDCWHASASWTCVRAKFVPRPLPAACIES